MCTATRWDLRGPVRALRLESAEWNRDAADWSPLTIRVVATFRADGQASEIERHNPDGSIVRDVPIYDERGLLTEVQQWTADVLTSRAVHTYDALGRGVSSTTIDAGGTERETERRRYDDNGRMVKAVFLPPEIGEGPIGIALDGLGTSDDDARERLSAITYHAADGPMFRVVFDRDQEGRVLSERVEFASAPLGWGIDGDMSDDERAALIALLAAEFGNHTFSQATYVYDAKGRRVVIVRTMGPLGETRVTCGYDDLDNPVERRTVDLRRGMKSEDGQTTTTHESSDVQHTRFKYQYDAHRNWIERIMWHGTDPDLEPWPSQIERRTITYDGD